MTTERDKRISIRLSADMFERLKICSERMGLAHSTYAAFAIGSFVASQERSIEHQRKMSEMSVDPMEMISDLMKDQEFLKIMKSVAE